MSHRDRRATEPFARTMPPVPVSDALRRFAEEYFAVDEAEAQQDNGRRRSGRTARKQVKHA